MLAVAAAGPHCIAKCRALARRPPGVSRQVAGLRAVAAANARSMAQSWLPPGRPVREPI